MGHLVGRLKLDRSLSRSEQVKTLLAGPSPISPMRQRLPSPLFPTTATTRINNSVVF